ncbi:MAG TPA: prephenate dehydrogenase [Thermomicrobiales bacterium]|nr:prephenate dehydrogenase [Thermomicrobiales bacterium]
MEKVAIIGLGLIGASIGIGLRQWAQAEEKGQQKVRVVGFDIDIAQQQEARRLKATDEVSWDLPSAVRDADLVIVATPVGAIPEVFQTIGDHLKHGSVVTDTCSTKSQVMNWARQLLPTTTSFVGGHPMAGKTQSTEGADAALFKGATWCVCPAVNAPEAAIQMVLGLATALGAQTQFIDPVEHDAFVGGVSHLPFLVSSALMNTVSAGPAWRDMKTLTATGFRDVSRLAAGSPTMYRDICETNRESLLRWLDEYAASLRELRALVADDAEAAGAKLESYFTQAREARADWATAERTDGALLQNTEGELNSLSLSNQFSQMLFGNLVRRRRPDRPSNGKHRAGRDDRS